MFVELKNEFLQISVNTLGAELSSVKSAQGHEYLWEGDPKVWAGKAPIVFPICGGLMDDEFILAGKTYRLAKHGFGRLLEYCVEKKTDLAATFLLRSNEETKACYPFDFEFRVTFALQGKALQVTYEVTNLGDDTMYFAFGGHEAYACKGGIEDYSIVFEQAETLSRHLVTGNYLNYKTVPVMDNTNCLELKNKYFEDDALIFTDLRSRKVALCDKNGENIVTVAFSGFDYLLVWTKPGAEYICIEPWNGLPDFVDSDKDITKKRGIVPLAGGKTYALDHVITFEK